MNSTQKIRYGILKITLMIALVAGMICSSSQLLKAADYGVSASDNGDGTITVTISGNVVGRFDISANGKSDTLYINNIGDGGKTVIATGSGTFNVTVVPTSVSNADYRLLEPDKESTTTTVQVGQIPQQEKPTNPTPEAPKENTNQTPTETPKQPTDEKKKEEKKDLSSDNKLASLTVSEGTLSPSFTAGNTSYTLNLTGNVSSVTISAKANDSKATIEGTGKISLKSGNNKAVVTVIAEDGSIKNYTINISVNKKPEVYLDYNGKKLGAVVDLDGIDKLNSQFEKVKLKIDGKDVHAWKNALLNKTVVYLIDEKTGDKDYYIYNETTKKVESVFRPMAILGNNFYIVDIDKSLQTRPGMEFGTVRIGKYDLAGWKFKDKEFANYSLIYVMNEKGQMTYYQYEAAEQSLQIYSGAAAITQKAYDDYVKSTDATLKKQKYIMYGLGGLAAVLVLIIVLLLIFRRKKTTKYQKVDIQGKSNTPKFHIEAEALTSIDDEE